jgi:sn-glycerol 3-phosphate transport system permease protein
MFFSVSISILLAIALAAYLKENTKFNALLQSFIFTPYVVSLISVAFIWMWLMDSDFGLLNFILKSVGLPAVHWLDDPKVAMFSMILVAVWKGIGYNTLILISAMQAIPACLYEAATLDNAKLFRTFFHITLPMISPTLFFLTLMNIIAAFKVFEQVNVMTAGGPMNATNTLVFDIYQYGFKFYKLGYASAQGVVLMVLIGICTAAYFGVLAKRVHYEGGDD